MKGGEPFFIVLFQLHNYAHLDVRLMLTLICVPCLHFACLVGPDAEAQTTVPARPRDVASRRVASPVCAITCTTGGGAGGTRSQGRCRGDRQLRQTSDRAPHKKRPPVWRDTARTASGCVGDEHVSRHRLCAEPCRVGTSPPSTATENWRRAHLTPGYQAS